MIRTLAAAAAALATLALADAASAQTYGQPLYLNAYGRPVGGTPLSEVETRSYVETGRWADGYADRPQVYVPAPGYGRPYVSYGDRYGRHYAEARRGYSRYGQRYDAYGHGHGHRHGYGCGHGGYDAPPRSGRRPGAGEPTGATGATVATATGTTATVVAATSISTTAETPESVR